MFSHTISYKENYKLMAAEQTSNVTIDSRIDKFHVTSLADAAENREAYALTIFTTTDPTVLSTTLSA
jgi:hypothetical protein